MLFIMPVLLICVMINNNRDISQAANPQCCDNVDGNLPNEPYSLLIIEELALLFKN